MRINGAPIRGERAVSIIRAVRTPSTAALSPNIKDPGDLTGLSSFSNVLSPGPEHAEKLARLRLAIATDVYLASAPEIGQRIVGFYLAA